MKLQSLTPIMTSNLEIENKILEITNILQYITDICYNDNVVELTIIADTEYKILHYIEVLSKKKLKRLEIFLNNTHNKKYTLCEFENCMITNTNFNASFQDTIFKFSITIQEI